MAVAVYDKWYYLFALAGLEIVFVLFRIILERRRTKCETAWIFVEWILFTITYVVMFLFTQSAVVTCICMAVVFIMYALLFSDLLDVYLNSENQFADLLSEEAPPGVPGSDRKLVDIL